MAWKQISNRTAIDIKEHAGQPYVGTYQGTRDIQTKFGQQVLHKLTDEEGRSFEIFGFTNLNRALQNVPPDSLVRIVYQGKERVETKFGPKDVHQVSVELYMQDEGEKEKLPF